MNRKPKIHYTDMAIYIDTHVNKPDADSAKIYDYLLMLSYMLAVKKRFFTREDYYDEFSHYFATQVYMRLTDKRQFWHTKTKKVNDELTGRITNVVITNEDGSPKMFPPEIEPIVSCLNYMKDIIYGRKCAFCNEEFEKLPQSDSNNVLCEVFRNDSITSLVNDDYMLSSTEFNDYVDNITNIIHHVIDTGVYGKDRLLSWKLYTSVLLSLLRNFTLSETSKNSLIDFKQVENFNDRVGDCRLYLRLNFENLLEKIMEEETRTAPIVYDLDSSYLDYVAFVMQKVKVLMIKDIKEICGEYSMVDNLVEDVLLCNMTNKDGDD